MEEIIDLDDSASSHLPEGWHAIDWRRVDQQVRTMQMRIAKATQEGDWRRVKALQRSLTRSFSARAVSVRRVTENQGKRTADALSNRVLLHPVCHVQLHANGLTVVKPASD